MKREYLTDEQVEQEIKRLLASDNVKLSRHEQYVKGQQYFINKFLAGAQS